MFLLRRKWNGWKRLNKNKIKKKERGRRRRRRRRRRLLHLQRQAKSAGHPQAQMRQKPSKCRLSLRSF
ncbi:hypothetical protein RchiOBHm_Chr5g0068481 [Rosa chinensis]|uniref:Uncharacterized protein n=1 Tax=Rosa chinensis TaxID=74649 RepID=A0A2P6QJP7_ROSCH|nr:hypothetical protein RchiOBHm_Chr5g0068481 [Rosa chinensis]